MHDATKQILINLLIRNKSKTPKKRANTQNLRFLHKNILIKYDEHATGQRTSLQGLCNLNHSKRICKTQIIA